jgi:hypothetical protein
MPKTCMHDVSSSNDARLQTILTILMEVFSIFIRCLQVDYTLYLQSRYVFTHDVSVSFCAIYVWKLKQ